MKKTLIVLSLIAVYFYSCTRIEGPYTLSSGEILLPYNGPAFEPIGTINQNVLLEKFTGQGCVNCPEAAEGIEEIAEKYGNRIIPMSIYSGFFADPVYFSFISKDLRTEYGDMHTEKFNVQAYPSILVNRTRLNSGDLILSPYTYSTLEQEVSLALNKTPKVAIQLKKSNTNGADTLYTKISFLGNDLPAKVFMQIVLIENGIVDAQIEHDGRNDEYMHQHVFRTNISPVWGTDISQFIQERSVKKMYLLPYSTMGDYNYEQSQLVVIVYDASSIDSNSPFPEVLQVEKIDL